MPQTVPPIPTKPKSDAVQAMFAPVAKRYDLANHILSAGMDFYWRRCLVAAVRACKPRHVVDLATGSGDVAFAIKRDLGASVRVEGLDFSEPMLEVARKKKKRSPSFQDIPFAFGDCLDLPLNDNTVDVLTIAFGLRNLEDRGRGLSEMHRALKPGGTLLVLEFSQPYAWVSPLYYAYLKHITPRIAQSITGLKEAYQYLGDSIQGFPNRDALSEELSAAGFEEVSALPLTLGTVALHRGIKKAD